MRGATDCTDDDRRRPTLPGRDHPTVVLVPDNQGRFEVAIGAVYSYYEFTQPVSNRPTDEAWRAMLNRDKAPDRPSWVQRVLAG